MKNLLTIILLTILGISLLSSCKTISHADNDVSHEDDKIDGDISYLLGNS